MIAAPEPEAQDRIEAMEQELVKDLPELEFINPEEQNFGSDQSDTKITDTENEQEASTADPDPEEQDDDDDESFYGMLKKVGII